MNVSLKKKSKREPKSDPRKNITTLHEEKLKYFEDLQASLPIKKKELDDIHNIQLDEKSTQEKFEIQDKITKLTNEIFDIENRTEENNYYLDTFTILQEYHSEANNISPSETIPLDSLSGFVEMKQTSNRSKLLQDYLKATNKYYVPLEYNYHKGKNREGIKETMCTDCKIPAIIDDSEYIYVCPGCGLVVDSFNIDMGKPGYKELQETTVTPNFCYKRINHFNELLSQIQAKETTQIPNQVIEKLKTEMKKEKMNPSKLTPKKVKAYLKKIEENKYYEHVMHIICLLNGKPPLIMSLQMEERLRKMFEEIQGPFDKHCPSNRKNFLNYSYVLHKFCQLLHYDEFLPYFPLLKSREKLYQQDQIWKKICYDLGYEFYPSV